MAGNGALDQQQAAFGVDTHDVEVLNGTGHIAQVASHALAGEDAARILRLADRAGHAVRTGVTVRGALRTEVVALDGAGETLTDRGARDVDLVAGSEHRFDGDDRAGGELGGAGGATAIFLL